MVVGLLSQTRPIPRSPDGDKNVDALDKMDRKYGQLSRRQYYDNDNRNNLPDDREDDDVNENRPQVQAADPRAAFQQL